MEDAKQGVDVFITEPDATLADVMPLEVIDIHGFKELFTLEFQSGQVLRIPIEVLTYAMKVYEIVPVNFVVLLGVPGANNDLVWKQLSVGLPTALYSDLLEKWSQLPVEAAAERKMTDAKLNSADASISGASDRVVPSRPQREGGRPDRNEPEPEMV